MRHSLKNNLEANSAKSKQKLHQNAKLEIHVSLYIYIKLPGQGLQGCVGWVKWNQYSRQKKAGNLSGATGCYQDYIAQSQSEADGKLFWL